MLNMSQFKSFFSKSKPDNWTPGKWTPQTPLSNTGPATRSKSAPKAQYLTNEQAQARRTSDAAKTRLNAKYTPGGLGTAGHREAWTDTEPGYDLMH
jgi:hypothetical protein